MFHVIIGIASFAYAAACVVLALEALQHGRENHEEPARLGNDHGKPKSSWLQRWMIVLALVIASGAHVVFGVEAMVRLGGTTDIHTAQRGFDTDSHIMTVSHQDELLRRWIDDLIDDKRDLRKERDRCWAELAGKPRPMERAAHNLRRAYNRSNGS